VAPVGSAVRLGIELSPALLADRDHGGWDRWQAAAGAAVQAGIDILWLGEPAGSLAAPGVDPVPMAGALATSGLDVTVGVSIALEGGRLPSAVARELAALDLLSAGRSALCLLGGPDGLGDDEAFVGAVRICRGLLAGEEVAVADPGSGAGPIRLHPVPTESPGPVLVAGPAIGPLDARVLESLAPWVDGLVSGGVPESIRSLSAAARAAGDQRLLWRGPIGEDGHSVAEAFEAGADGVIAVVDAGVSFQAALELLTAAGGAAR
jgi:alkanesulfonate monooxygenase SsuD/methylene tetrahydromethanopterin reductase-like flavin-dependent oxidoreductase (luciferase family)